jgi:hypothetical protein
MDGCERLQANHCNSIRLYAISSSSYCTVHATSVRDTAAVFMEIDEGLSADMFNQHEKVDVIRAVAVIISSVIATATISGDLALCKGDNREIHDKPTLSW